MFRFVAVFALVSFVAPGSLPDELDGCIVVGVETTIDAYPYQLSLQIRNGAHFCGGSIISPRIIVTAAHCLKSIKPSEIRVRVGSTNYNRGGELVDIKAYIIHEDYNAATKANDIAILNLATPVQESTKVRYITLATKTPAAGTRAVVTGWNTNSLLNCIISSNILQKVEVNIADNNACEYTFGSQYTETNVCATAQKSYECQGDSGDPMVVDNELIGISSRSKGCPESGNPAVYIDIPSYYSWIIKTMAEF